MTSSTLGLALGILAFSCVETLAADVQIVDLSGRTQVLRSVYIIYGDAFSGPGPEERNGIRVIENGEERLLEWSRIDRMNVSPPVKVLQKQRYITTATWLQSNVEIILKDGRRLAVALAADWSVMRDGTVRLRGNAGKGFSDFGQIKSLSLMDARQ